MERAPEHELAQLGGGLHLVHRFLPAGFEAKEYPAAHLHSSHESDWFTICTVLAIAVTVFFSALTGFWFSRAELRSNEAAERSLTFARDMSARQSRLGSALNLEISDLAFNYEARARRAVARQRLAQLPPAMNNVRAAENAHLASLSGFDQQEFGDSLIEDAEDGQDGDLQFPS